ncbi:MAG: hypothetical protein WB626_10555, partial [Bacteroidota bacterium]
MRPASRAGLLLAALAFLGGCAGDPGARQREADAALGRARDAYERKLYGEAERLLGAAHELDSRLGRVAQMAEELELLGSIHGLRADFDSAHALLERAAELYRQLGRPDAAHAALLGSVSGTILQGRLPEAHLLLTEALRKARLFKEEEQALSLQWELFRVCAALEYREEEAAHLGEIRARAIARGDTELASRTHLEAGLSALARGDTARAGGELLRGLGMAEGTGDSLLGVRMLEALGMVQAGCGRTQEALDTYAEGSRRAGRFQGGGEILQRLRIRSANAHLTAGEPEAAAPLYREALAEAGRRGDKLAEGYLFAQTGLCESLLGNEEPGFSNAGAAVDLFAGVGYARGLAHALFVRAHAALLAGRTVPALEDLQRGVDQEALQTGIRDPLDVYTECEKSSSGGEGACADAAAGLLLQTGRHEEAFGMAALSGARALG